MTVMFALLSLQSFTVESDEVHVIHVYVWCKYIR